MMKIRITFVFLVFIQIAFVMFKVLYANENPQVSDVDIPTFETPVIEFRNLTGGCGGFVDCIEYLAAVVLNIGAGVIFLVLFIIELIGFLFQLIALLIIETVSGVQGAPWWLQTLFRTPLAVAVGIILWRMVRQGNAEA